MNSRFRWLSTSLLMQPSLCYSCNQCNFARLHIGKRSPSQMLKLVLLLIQSWVHPTMPGITLPLLLGDYHPGGLGGVAPAPTPGIPPPALAPIPAPGPVPSPAPSPAQRQVKVRNPNVDAQIAVAMQGRNFHITSLFNHTVHPPKHDDDTEVCCSYHWRAKYSLGCGRNQSHCPLTKSEQVRNLDFLQEHVINPDLGCTPAAPAAPSN